ncbi:MAG: RNA polymerase sigma factor [Parcubacteria group bacterium GW2011_GWA2_39_18]|nr:MAG: RNA polymerase sigma factor [Parcubacteria group bacterium GW2011_GWA2_39_18]
MSTAKNLHPLNLVKEFIAQLPPRQRQVIVKRFGLHDGRRCTLEEIGQEWGITRERVRQIEASAIKTLKESAMVDKIIPAVQHLQQHFVEHGDLRKEMKLLEEDLDILLDKSAKSVDQKSAIFFLLTFADPFVRHMETSETHVAWSINKNTYEKLKLALKSLKVYLKQKNQLLKEQELLESLNKILSAREFAKLPIARTEKSLRSWLDISKEIKPNVFKEYGLTEWPSVKPRGVKDMAHMVMFRHGKPMHFKEIADAINAAKFSSKQAYSQTVHNELIKDKRFVLVGRGTYALSEWGYKPGIVKDVITDILKNSKKSLSKTEIIEKVQKERMVKPNTIILNLNNKRYFRKNSDDKFEIAK